MRRLLGLTVAALAAMLLAVSPAQATFPGKNGKLLGEASQFDPPCCFFRESLFSVNPDGSDLSTLYTGYPGADFRAPMFSPDGSKIVFQPNSPRGCCGNGDVVIMNADGTGQFDLSSDAEGDVFDYGHPTWAPNGERLLFGGALCLHHCGYDLYTIKPDGTGLVQLTTDEVSHPATWSPDSSKVAYGSNDGLYVIDASGGAARRLADGAVGQFAGLSWSPDGSRIAFLGTDGLYTIKPDGTGIKLLTSPGGVPRWSPDGSRILFGQQHQVSVGSLCCHVGEDFYTIRPDGTGLRQIRSDSFGGVWSPDGQKIAFDTIRDLNERTYIASVPEDIWVTNADGSGPTQVTNSLDGEGVDDWQAIPGPKRFDYKNSNAFCKAEQAFWGDQFGQRYRNFGQCVSGSR